MKDDTQEKLAKSLTAESASLLPYLPYLLQDLWELGSSPDGIVSAAKSCGIGEGWRVLDLGCGKGAVSVRLAQEFGCLVKGIDLMDDFLEYARIKADELGVNPLCGFEAGDINRAVENEAGFDLVILGAVSGVMGTPSETLGKLKRTIKPGGYVIIDDGYLGEGPQAPRLEGDYYTRDEWLRAFEQAGMELISEIPAGEETQSVNDSNTAAIAARAAELAAAHPEHKALLENYVTAQQQECDDMTDSIVSCMWLLRSASGV
jgi:ubiquinone/menaquinone biosynthesis C-methylase UbiE